MAADDDRRADPLCVAVVGDGDEAFSERLEASSRPVTVHDLPEQPDVFDLTAVDAVVAIGTDAHDRYRRVRAGDPTTPVVLVDPTDDGVADPDDRYARVVEPVGGEVPVALVLARVRQLARQPRSGVRSRTVERAGTPPVHRERPRTFYALWAAAILAYGVGDTVSTAVGIESAGLAEGNPVVAWLIDDWGFSAFIALKVAIFGVLMAISLVHSRRREPRHVYWPPVVLTIAGVSLTAWNLMLILSA